MADIKERIIIEAVDNTTRGMRSAQNKLNAFDRTLKRIQTTMLGFVGVNIAGHLIAGLTRMSDSAVELDAKLRLMTDSTEDFNYAQQELVKISLESGSSLEANIILFTRMNRAIKSMGGNTQTTLDTTRALSQGLRISGASTQESASVIRQWSQAMASGVLRGEEFNAVSENGSRIIQALSTSLGVTIGELRAMSKEGELTAKVVTDALLQQSKVLAEENAKLPLTIGRAIENINTKWTLMLQGMASGNADMANIINGIANHFNELAHVMGALIKVSIAYASLKLGQHFISEAKAIRDSIIASKAKAQAVIYEAESTKLLVTAGLAEQAQLTKIALVKKQAHVASTEAHISETRNRIQRIALVDNELKQQIAATQRQIAWERKINNSQAISIANQNKLNALKQRARLSADALRTATMSLAGAEQNLTRALVGQTVALDANYIAQRAHTTAINTNIVATSRWAKVQGFLGGFLGKNSKLMKGANKSLGILKLGFAGVGKVIGRLGSALFGLPGIIAFVVYEAVNYLIGFDLAVQYLENSFRKLGAYIQYGLWDEDSLKRSLDAIDADFNEWFDNRTAQTKAMANGFSSAEEQRVQEAIDANRRLDILDKQRAELTKSYNDLRVEDHENMLSRIADLDSKNSEDLQSKIDNIEFEAELQKIAFDKQIKSKEDFEKLSLDLEKSVNEEKYKLQEAYFQESATLYKTFYTEQATLVKENSVAELNLRKEMILKLKDINDQRLENTRNRIKELGDLQQKSVDDIRDAKDKIKQLEERGRDFLREINNTQIKDYQKNSNAQAEYSRINNALKKADLEAEKGNFAEATKLRDKALDDLENLAKTEKKRSEDAQSGSLAEIQARSNATNAVNLYKDALKDAINGQKDFEDSSKKSADEGLNRIVELTKQMDAFQEASDKASKEIDQINIALNAVDEIELMFDMDTINRQIATIDAEIKKLSQTVKVDIQTNETQAKQSGGVVHRAAGGFIPRSNKVPGSGSGDKVKALLEPGEFIMRKSAVQSIGESAMYAMNRNGEAPIRRKHGGMIDAIQRFATGGKVDENSVYDREKDKYLELLDIWIKKAQSNPDGGRESYLRSYRASGVVSTIQEILSTLPKLKGKSFQEVGDVVKMNDDIFRLVRSGAGGGASDNNRNRYWNMKELRDQMVQLLNGGGIIQRFAEGGSVPGSGLGDKIKALLTPGEFVIKKPSVAQWGTDFMHSINQGIMPQKFANGGLVGVGEDGAETINVNFNINGSSATGTFAKNDATMSFIDQLKSSEASS